MEEHEKPWGISGIMKTEYDFIIVGAGASGSIIADRLSENGRFDVLVLEAGGMDSNPWIQIPIGYAKTLINKALTWGYRTKPQQHLNNRDIFWPRGKVVGGSAAINGLIYIRGLASDYDGWAKMGCKGWSWNEVEPYFHRSERFVGADFPEYGRDGGITITPHKGKLPLSQMFIEAAEKLGLPRNDGFNGPSQDGAGYYHRTVDGWRRSYSARSYLHPALKRKNISLQVNALAERLIIEGRKVCGVVYRQGGKKINVKARKEVILSGGAINSPQLLMCSGIGPAADLAALGIQVVCDQPEIGRNLQDHLQCRMVFKVKHGITLNSQMRNPLRVMKIGLDYIFGKRGPLTYAAGQAGAFFKTDPSLAEPDGQIYQFPFSSGQTGEPLHPFSGFTTTVTQSRPLSRGTIKLASADIAVAPEIDPNYLGDEADKEFFLKGLRMMRTISQTAPLRQEISEEYWPGAEVQSDEEWLSYMRGMAGSIFHPCGTVRMGGDAGAPLNPALELQGLAGCRVVDASVIPQIMSGNINAACMMIAQKASDMILEKYN